MSAPTKYEVRGCPKNCSLNAVSLPGKVGELIHGWFEEGNTYAEIQNKAKAVGVRVSNGALGRHKTRHLVPLEDGDPLVEEEGSGSDLEVLELIIRKGGRSLRGKQINVGVDGVLRAIDLKYKLTQGNVFETFLQAMGGALDELDQAGGAPEEEGTDGQGDGGGDRERSEPVQ
jgi:hypothetical protein